MTDLFLSVDQLAHLFLFPTSVTLGCQTVKWLRMNAQNPFHQAIQFFSFSSHEYFRSNNDSAYRSLMMSWKNFISVMKRKECVCLSVYVWVENQRFMAFQTSLLRLLFQVLDFVWLFSASTNHSTKMSRCHWIRLQKTGLSHVIMWNTEVSDVRMPYGWLKKKNHYVNILIMPEKKGGSSHVSINLSSQSIVTENYVWALTY